jgi:hypothetical protein
MDSPETTSSGRQPGTAAPRQTGGPPAQSAKKVDVQAHGALRWQGLPPHPIENDMHRRDAKFVNL